MRERLQSEHGVRTLLERPQSDHRVGRGLRNEHVGSPICDAIELGGEKGAGKQEIENSLAHAHMRACRSMCVALAREYRGVSHMQHRDNVEREAHRTRQKVEDPKADLSQRR